MALLGRDGRARIEFKSISFPSPNVGFVRFTKTIERRSSDTVVLSLVATVAFVSNLAPMTDDDRLLNPLGFTVRDYRLDTETP